MENNQATAPDALTELVALLRDRFTVGEVEGLDRAGAAKFLGVSLALIDRMNSTGEMPVPSQLAERCPRWSRTELRAWLLAGSPSRLRWQSMRDGAIRRAG